MLQHNMHVGSRNDVWLSRLHESEIMVYIHKLGVITIHIGPYIYMYYETHILTFVPWSLVCCPCLSLWDESAPEPA